MGLGQELWVRLSDRRVTEEVLETDNERDAISLKQVDGTLITFVDFKQVRDGPIYHLLLIKGCCAL